MRPHKARPNSHHPKGTPMRRSEWKSSNLSRPVRNMAGSSLASWQASGSSEPPDLPFGTSGPLVWPLADPVSAGSARTPNSDGSAPNSDRQPWIGRLGREDRLIAAYLDEGEVRVRRLTDLIPVLELHRPSWPFVVLTGAVILALLFLVLMAGFRTGDLTSDWQAGRGVMLALP